MSYTHDRVIRFADLFEFLCCIVTFAEIRVILLRQFLICFVYILVCVVLLNAKY